MSSPLYIPCASLSDEDVSSLVKLCLAKDVYRVDTHGGRKAALKYLLKMHSIGFDLSSYIDLKKFEDLQQQFEELKKIDSFKKNFDENHNDTFEEYWELNSNSTKIHQIAKDSRKLTDKPQGFSPEQLKIYFNSQQIDNIPYSEANFDSSGFVDNDSRDWMIKYPIEQRQNKGQINTKQGRIEQVIFDIPPDKQIIILDFADERMPGG
jgi:hypothetical protein